MIKSELHIRRDLTPPLWMENCRVDLLRENLPRTTTVDVHNMVDLSASFVMGTTFDMIPGLCFPSESSPKRFRRPLFPPKPIGYGCSFRCSDGMKMSERRLSASVCHFDVPVVLRVWNPVPSLLTRDGSSCELIFDTVSSRSARNIELA